MKGIGRSTALRVMVPLAVAIALFIGTFYLLAIPAVEDNLLASKKETIKELTDATWQLLAAYNHRVETGELMLADAQERVSNRIRYMRYGLEGKDYFWINDMHPHMIMHPYRTDLEGKDISDLADPSGKHLFVEFVKVVEANDRGYVNYMWQWKDDPDRIVPKLSYVRGFEPWGWIIGTGIYLEDVESKITAITRKLNRAFLLILFLIATLSTYIVWRGTRTEKERTKAVAALAESENRYYRLTDNAQDVIFRMSLPDGHYEYISSAATALFGFSPDDFYKNPLLIRKIIHPDWQEYFQEEWEKLLVGDMPPFYEYQVLLPSGEQKWMNQRNVLIRNEAGEPIAMEGIVTDITERKLSETALQESREQLRETSALLEATLNAIPDILGVQDLDHRIIRYNAAGYQFVNKTLQEVSGKKCFELIGSTSPCSDCATTKVYKTRKPASVEKYLKEQDIWLEARAYPVFNHNGDLTHVIEHLRDITEAKRTNEALRESESRYRNLFELSPQGITLADVETGVLVDVNARLCELAQYSKEEIVGHTATELGFYLEDNREKFKNELLQSGFVNGMEMDFRTRDGSILHMLIFARIVQIAERTHSLTMFLDISQQKKLEDQLRQSQKMEAIGRLAGGVAHDFNNILTGINGYAEMILLGLEPDNQNYSDIQEIQKAGQRASSLTSQLLAFSRKQIISPVVLELNGVISNSTKMLERIIGEDIQLEFHPQEKLGAIKADQGQLDQILINLAVNARDAMPSGGHLIIETANKYFDETYCKFHNETSPGEYILLAVSDDGQGIDRDAQEHIFEPFFSTKEKGKGTGLGLATVYGIVKQNKGFINVYSEKGSGTTFKIYFPKITDKTQPVAKPGVAKNPRGTETVLLVEDEEMVRRLAKAILEKHGYYVLAAEHGEEAKALSRKFKDKIQLLLTDVVMPGINGRELYLTLKDERPDLKVLFMSGYTQDIIAHHGVLEEGTSFLPKPFTVKSMTHKVREVLDG